MGGKNCVIVDSDADLDDAVPAIVQCAFVYAGQKCSAASRVLVHEAIADALLERVAGAVEVARRSARPTRSAPTSRRSSSARRRSASSATATLAAQRRARSPPRRADGRARAHGWFCAPTVAADLPADSAVLDEEIFGPLLAVERVRDVDDALRPRRRPALRADRRAVLPQPRAPSSASSRRTPVGNLYVNRPITGAMVGRQPFGGNRLSGTGTKAGGPDYLLHFVEPRVVTENTVRHGLVI